MSTPDGVLAAIDAWAAAIVRDAEAGLVAFSEAFAKTLPPEASAVPEEETTDGPR